MPASPWRTFGTPDPNFDFVVLLSFLPLKSYWRVLPFFFYTARVVWQLVGARPGGLFASSASVQEAILDALRLEERRRPAGFRSASTAFARHDRARSLHGQDEVRALGD